nr:hypothetical protein [Actinomycetota bacterium]
MSESTKKRPSWLSGEPPAAEEVASRFPGRKGPLAEADTGELRTAREAPADGPRTAGEADEAVTRVSMPGAGAGRTNAAPKNLAGRVRASAEPAALVLVALLMLALVFYFLFLRGGGEERTAAEGPSSSGEIGQAAGDPFAGGPVRDTGVLFGALQESDGEAKLDGAGLDWSGTVTKKEGEAGETITLEGPTAAQVERGFDLGTSSVETGVYAVAQEGGEVLHVTTHTFLPEEEGADVQELSLGTVYSLEEGELGGYAYYLDERQNGSNEVTRTYVRPGAESYSVSYEAEPGTFVPL